MNFDVTRAWKDETYRQSLSEEERSHLPENPVGEIELSESELEAIHGGWNQNQGGQDISTNGYCTFLICIVSFICHSGVACI